MNSIERVLREFHSKTRLAEPTIQNIKSIGLVHPHEVLAGEPLCAMYPCYDLTIALAEFLHQKGIRTSVTTEKKQRLGAHFAFEIPRYDMTVEYYGEKLSAYPGAYKERLEGTTTRDSYTGYEKFPKPDENDRQIMIRSIQDQFVRLKRMKHANQYIQDRVKNWLDPEKTIQIGSL